MSTPDFDHDVVASFVKLLSDQDALWHDWFEPIVVTYEELVADRLGAIRRVLAELGLDPKRIRQGRTSTGRPAGGRPH